MLKSRTSMTLLTKDHHNDSNPLGGVLAWKQVMELQSEDINNDKTANLTQLQNLVVNTSKIVLHPQDVDDWVKNIDTFANKLAGHVNSTTVSELSVPMVLSFLETKKGAEWESWRAFAQELKPLKYKIPWRTASAKMHHKYRE